MPKHASTTHADPMRVAPRRWMLAVLPGLLAGLALIVVSVTSGDGLIGVIGVSSIAATAWTAREIRSPAPRVSMIFFTWMVALTVAVPLLPVVALVAVAVPLTTAVSVAGLVFKGRDSRLMILAGLVMLVWQFAWLMIGGVDRGDAAIPAVIVIGGLSAGMVVTRVARSALESEQLRYESLFNGVPAGLYRSDPAGNILAANQPLAEMLGFEAVESLLATNANDLYFDVGDRERAIRSIETGVHEDVLFRLRRKDGAPIWVRETARAITDALGNATGYEGVIEDVTKRIEAERTAAQAEERFSIAFEAAPIGMALVDTQGRFHRVNNAFCELVGRSPEEMEGLNWREITPPEDEAASAEPVRRLQPGDTVEYERRYYHSSGEVRWGRVSMSMLEDGSESIPRLVVQLADITPQKELQQHLEQLVRSKDEFVASVSHELRTPLTAVLGLTRELADSRTSFSDEETDELIQLVAEQSADVAHIVEDLLVAARADIGGLTISSENVDLAKEADRALRECQHLVGSKSIAVATPDRPVLASADSARLRQIVRNLLTNALRYGGANVSVVVASHNGSATLSVRDDGPGLAPDEWVRIFEPYYRAHSRGTVAGSIGLGLSVSKRLAEAMDGDLTYRYDQGQSVFELALPTAG